MSKGGEASATATAAVLAACSALAAGPGRAHAQEVLLQNQAARVALTPYAATAGLGGRAEVSARLGALDAAFTAALERGGGNALEGAWGAVNPSAAWLSDDMRIDANWTPRSDAKLTVEAGDRLRYTRTFADAVGSGADGQLATDASRFLRVRAATQTARLDLDVGAEATLATLDTQTLDGAVERAATRLSTTSRRVFADFTWRPLSQVSLQVGEAAQALAVDWRGGSSVGSQAAYLTPTAALTLTPWGDGRWRLSAGQTLSPIDPAQFAAYAQLATPGTGSAPQPDHGWRYALRFEQDLPGGAKLTAEGAEDRLASVTELGPVGAGEAPVSIGTGLRRQLEIKVAAPLPALRLPGAALDGGIDLHDSRVLDPFTGQPRAISGVSPFAAQLTLSGALPRRDLSWSLTARADGPQSLYQMTQVTNLSATAGLGGALTYGAGPAKLSLEVDNLVGGGRDVTTLYYAGPRSLESVSGADRRRDDSRAVRITLHRGL